MVSNSGYALLIGIDHYEELGDSAQLLGSRNDVLMWHWFCRQQLGIPSENILMLTSPKLDPVKDFGGDTVPAGSLGEATAENIRKGHAWLLQNMDGGKSPGLLTYSGHGLLLGAAPALSTSDIKADGTGALLLRDIGEAVQAANAQQALTAVFDCCHIAAPAAKSDLRSPTSLSFGAADAAAIEDEDFNVCHRVFLASRPGQPAHQGKLGRNVHGALSFALVTAAEQWKASQAAGQTGIDVNHKQLFKRARKILRALRMKQSPKLRVPFDREGRSFVRKMPFFGLHSDVTTRKPDAQRHRIQLDPNEASGDYTLYTLTVTYTPDGGKSTTQTSQVLSVGNSCTTLGYTGGKEYWNLSQAFLNAFGSGNTVSSLAFTSATGSWGSNPAQPTGWTGSNSSPTMASSVTWGVSTSSPASGTLYQGNYGLCVSGTPSAPSPSWYILASSTPTGYVVSAGGATFGNTPAPSLRSGQSWYVPS
jgi:hypothetical protein